MHRPIFIVCVLLALGWLGIEPSKAQDTVTPTNEGQNAPISVAMSFKRYDYMLFEPVIVEVEIRNTSAQDIILSSDNAEIPWISFIITDPRGKTVKRDRGAVFEAKLLKSQGQPLRFTIDITPYYQIRNPGEYRLRTVIGLPFGDPVITNPQRFQIREGKTLYSTSRNYQSSNLTYSIMKFSPDLSNSYAYARVEDPNANRVYANTSLGEITDTNPQILFDDSGNIHVLHIIGSGEYRYSRLDAMGGLQNQSKYISANGVPPKLMRMQDGGVLVAGGEQDKEKERKRLSSSVAKTPGGAPASPESYAPPSTSAPGTGRSGLSQTPPASGGSPSSYAPPSPYSVVPPASAAKPDAGVPSRTVGSGGSRSK